MRAVLVLVLPLAFAACGAEPTSPTPPKAPPARLVVPADPDEALAWVQEMANEPQALRARLDAWPTDADHGDEAFLDDEASQVAWTWRLRLALQDGDVERAATLRRVLGTHFEGRGQYPIGREMAADTLRLGILEEALDAARRRIGGSRPVPKRARAALDVAGRMLTASDGADRKRWQATARWVKQATLDEMLAAVGARARPPEGTRLTVLVLADDFTLGDGVFREVLKQWTRDHTERGLAALLVPLLRGQVRVNLRLLPVGSAKEELASIGRRAADMGLTPARPIPATAMRRIGLGVGDAAILLADARGRIVARLAGRGPDLRELEPALQKLLSR